MDTLRVGSLNINGARDVYKREMLKQHMQHKKLDVLFLQETHSDEDDEVQWKMWWEGSLFLSHGSNVSAGVAVLFSPGLSLCLTSSKEVCKGRMLITHCKVHQQEYIFVNVYAPNVGKDRGLFFSTLKHELALCNEEAIFVFGGDWN